MYIDRDESRVGLFGYIKDGIVKNVQLIDVDITGSNYTGGLVGWSENSNIRNSTVTGNIEGATGVGGLVGHNFFSAEIYLSRADVNVSGDNNVGGLVGNNWANIRRSSASGNVSSFGPFGSGSAGGLAGNSTTLIESSYSTAAVEGQEGVGGLVGENSGEIENSYSLGSVTGTSEVGGFSGTSSNDSEVTNSFSTGLVSGNEDVGGFIGVNGGTILSSYWDTQTSQRMDGLGRGSSTGVTGLITEEFTGSNANENMPELAFEIVWAEIPDSYPKLLWSIPLYKIESIETNSPILSGEVLNVDVNLKNIGGITGESDVSLIDQEGSLVESSNQVILENGEETSLNFEWVSPASESGGYEFTVEVQYEVVNFDIETLLSPGIVNLISPSDENENTSIDADFIWNETENAVEYKFQISADESFESPIVNKSVSDTTFNLTQNLTYDSQYFWRVRGINEAGESDWSEIWSFTTILAAPSITILSTPANNSSVNTLLPEFSWNEADRADQYSFQLASDQDFSSIALDSTLTATTFVPTNKLDSGADYYWRVKASNEGGASEWSEFFTFNIGTTVSNELGEAPVEFTLQQNYPNPFNPTTQIRYGIPQAADVQLTIYNMLGQKVAILVDSKRSAGWHTASFDASGLSSGAYIYRIQAGEFTSTKKLTLIK